MTQTGGKFAADLAVGAGKKDVHRFVLWYFAGGSLPENGLLRFQAALAEWKSSLKRVGWFFRLPFVGVGKPLVSCICRFQAAFGGKGSLKAG